MAINISYAHVLQLKVTKNKFSANVCCVVLNTTHLHKTIFIVIVIVIVIIIINDNLYNYLYIKGKRHIILMIACAGTDQN